MNSKSTWIWLLVTGALLAFILFFERHWGQPPPGPAPLLPDLKPAAVTRLRIFGEASQQQEIRVEITNGNWWITQPVLYPAQRSAIDRLLTGLQQLMPATLIARSELLRRPKAEEEFGFDNPRASLVIQQEGVLPTIKFGRRTAPGDQVFVQIVGREDIYVVDAELLKLLPGAADDWRDRSLGNFSELKFDSISINNAGSVTILQLDVTNQVWRITEPLVVRADSAYLSAMQRSLELTRVHSFISDKPRADLDTLGLQPPQLSIAFARSGATALLLKFGKTNAVGQCFAQLGDNPSVVTVPADVLKSWQQTFYKFRELRLLTLPPGLTALEVHGPENFVLERTGTNQWRVAGEKFPVDAGRVQEFLGQLGNLEIVDFIKDVVSTQEFGLYGLTSSVRQVVFKTSPPAGGTNAGILQLEFGHTNREAIYGEAIYTRRSDEASVYAVRQADLQHLLVAGWQLRERRIWHFNPPDLARITIRKGGWLREMVRSGVKSWGLAPGSQGVLDVDCTEEIVRQLSQLSVTGWNARGAAAAEDARFGFGTNSLALALETKTGGKMELQFGGYSSAKYPYARVTLEGEPWVFEFSFALHQFLLSCLSIPPGAP